MQKVHTFHIPVMGIGFSVDTPLKVSPLGIDSVISLVDDVLLEKLRKVFSEKFQLPYTEITDKIHDFRAKRITSYLNLINDLVDEKIKSMRHSANDFKNYMELLPDFSKLKSDFQEIKSKAFAFKEQTNHFFDQLYKGSIDVNIMTKVDKTNYQNGKELSVEYNDAHAAFRGFANSNLNSSVILSAGMNTRLFNYMESFDDFYPDENAHFKKRIILKVSDFKSSIIQGKYLAKKGLWVSEFRIESGLNCGGHAFASDGFLAGPILEEFKARRHELQNSMYELFVKGLKARNKTVPTSMPKLSLTYQGGVGTNEEHQLLLDYYNLDSIGWGSPFLLVEGITSVDANTQQLLADAKEEDLYLSGVSPLGVPFNNLRGNTKDIEKQDLIDSGKPGSTCPRKFVKLNTELTSRPICTASRAYQQLKIKELDKKNLDPMARSFHYDKIVEKSCICAGLGTSALVVNKVETSDVGPGISVCPGPNMAYFSKVVQLKQMIDHIYGRDNVITHPNRPNVFIKELRLYIDYLKNQISELEFNSNHRSQNALATFSDNLIDGINYYRKFFSDLTQSFVNQKEEIFKELADSATLIENLKFEISQVFTPKTLNLVPIRQ